MTKNIFFRIFLCFCLLLNIQTTEIYAQKAKIVLKKQDFENVKDFRTAKKYKRKGLRQYRIGNIGSYKYAVHLFNEAHKLAPNNAGINYYLGSSYLNSSPKHRSLSHFLAAYKENPKVSPDIFLKIARGYHMNYEFQNAREYYSKYKAILTPKQLIERDAIIQKYIQETLYGEKYVAAPERVFIDNLPDINSEYADYSPTITPDGKTMYFTTRRPNAKGKTKTYGPTQQYYERVFKSEQSKRLWGEPQPLPKPINKTKKNIAVLGIQPGNQELILFNGAMNYGEIAQTKITKKGKWTKPKTKLFKRNNSAKGKEVSASVNYNGRELYFSTDNPKRTTGGFDIYTSTRNAQNQIWKKPAGIGNTINSEYDETSVFISADGKTLYFSSDGHSSMGGQDIFRSEKQADGTWSTPVNMGYPVNTVDDDMFFSITANQRYGYCASQGQTDKSGDWDIYKITFLGPEKPLLQNSEDMLIASLAKPITETIMEKTVEIQTIRLTIVKGIITDSFDGSTIAANIEIIDNETEEVMQTVQSNPETGDYVVTLPSGKNYAMMVNATDYLFHSENFNIPEATNYQEIAKDIQMHKLAAGSRVVLNNIAFEFGKTVLQPSSYPELNYVVKLMNAYKTLVIEISGHTDNIGSAASNQKLSEERAKTVVDYLLGHGLDPGRLEYKGYGLAQPIAPNNTEEGRAINRRVEFKILKK